MEEIAEQLNYDVRSIYKRFDRDMYTFGLWLTQDCSNANTFKNMKNQLEMELCAEYNKREIIITDNKAWNKLRSDCLKKLSQRIDDSINNIIIK